MRKLIARLIRWALTDEPEIPGMVRRLTVEFPMTDVTAQVVASMAAQQAGHPVEVAYLTVDGSERVTDRHLPESLSGLGGLARY